MQVRLDHKYLAFSDGCTKTFQGRTVGYSVTFSKYVLNSADEHLYIKLMIQMKYLKPIYQRFFTFL